MLSATPLTSLPGWLRGIAQQAYNTNDIVLETSALGRLFYW
jgi:hypothetical protein